MMKRNVKECSGTTAYLRPLSGEAVQLTAHPSDGLKRRGAVQSAGPMDAQCAAGRYHAAATSTEVEAFVRSRGKVVPADVCCPLAGRWMRTPVLTPAGRIYERENIYQFWQTSDADPVAGVRLAERRAVPSALTQQKCEAFKQAVLQRHPDAADLFS
jgi:hypothetical protein